MIKIERLSYVRIPVNDVAASAAFFSNVLGLEQVEREQERAYFRSDSRAFSVLLDGSCRDTGSVGLEVRDADILEEAFHALVDAGLRPKVGGKDECQIRRVKALVSFLDHSGNALELVWRPLSSGWRFYGTRDLGVTGLQSVALRTTSITRDEVLWTQLLNTGIADWVGDDAYLKLDDVHHRVSLHPSRRPGILATTFEVESIDQVMRAAYLFRGEQVRIVHGPGKEPVSGRMFLTFATPDEHLFAFATPMERLPEGRLPRQFARVAASFCSWGSPCDIPELNENITKVGLDVTSFSEALR